MTDPNTPPKGEDLVSDAIAEVTEFLADRLGGSREPRGAP